MTETNPIEPVDETTTPPKAKFVPKRHAPRYHERHDQIRGGETVPPNQGRVKSPYLEGP
jgi:hypothetical protein